MTIDYISDIHLEKYTKHIDIHTFTFQYLKPKNGDILILNGDISDHLKDLDTFFKVLNEYFDYKMIIYTLGNHEHWSKYEPTFIKLKKIQEISKHNNIYLLINNIVNLNKIDKSLPNLNLFGGNIFYDFHITRNIFEINEKEIIKIWKSQNDFNMTKNFFNKNYSYLDFNKNSILETLKYEHIDIFVNHVAPSSAIIHSKNWLMKNDLWNKNLGNLYFEDNLILDKFNIKYWFFGHTHQNLTFRKKDTTFICNAFNSYGYDLNNRIKIPEILQIFI